MPFNVYCSYFPCVMILGGALIELYDGNDLEIISVRSIFDIRLYEALLLIFPRLIEKMVKKKK